jgi:hypothetical protein
VYSFKVFPQCRHCARCLFQSASAVFQSASAVPCARIDIRVRSVHTQKVWPCVEPPSLGLFEAIGAGSPTSLYAASPSLCGIGG